MFVKSWGDDGNRHGGALVIVSVNALAYQSHVLSASDQGIPMRYSVSHVATQVPAQAHVFSSRWGKKQEKVISMFSSKEKPRRHWVTSNTARTQHALTTKASFPSKPNSVLSNQMVSLKQDGTCSTLINRLWRHKRRGVFFGFLQFV